MKKNKYINMIFKKIKNLKTILNSKKIGLWYFDHGKNDPKVVFLRRNIENTKKVLFLRRNIENYIYNFSMYTV